MSGLWQIVKCAFRSDCESAYKFKNCLTTNTTKYLLVTVHDGAALVIDQQQFPAINKRNPLYLRTKRLLNLL